LKKSLWIILILLAFFQIVQGEEIKTEEIKEEEIKEDSLNFTNTSESGIKVEADIKIEDKKQKNVSGLSPLLILTLFGQDDNNESSVKINGEDIPIIGSFYCGNIEGNREKLYGVGFNTSTGIEFIYQNRKYRNKDECAGFFTGSIITAGINSMRTHLKKDSSGKDTVYISNSEGKKVYSWGIRAGGNMGYRFKLGNSGTYISTRAGVVLPLHFISGGHNYNVEQKRELYATNAFYKMWDFGLHLEYMF
jgi:hypothetical protein